MRVSVALTLLSMIIAAAVSAVAPATAQEKTVPLLAVTGEATVTAAPDMAVVLVGVVTQAPRAADALAQNSKAMSAVVSAAKESGIEPRDIETSQIALRPQYNYPPQGTREAPKLSAYEAGNSVSMRVRDLSKLGALLDRLVVSGANQIRGVELTLAKPEPLRDEARSAAMKDAIRTAGILADAAGVRIVRVFSIREEVQDSPRPLMRMTAEAAARAPVPVEAGEQEVRARIAVEFEIAPKSN
jgi:uncharacterized protein YggE